MNTTTAEMPRRKVRARAGRGMPTARVAKAAPDRRSLFEALRSLGPVEIKGR